MAANNPQPPLYLVPRNISETVRFLETRGYALAEFANPPMNTEQCNFPNMLKMGPEGIIVCLFYLFGIGGIFGAAIYLYWQSKRGDQRRQRYGQRVDQQIPLREL